MKLPTWFTSAYARLLAHHRPTVLTVAILCGGAVLALAGAITLSTRWHNADGRVTTATPITAQTQSQPNHQTLNLQNSNIAAASHGRIATPSPVFSAKRHDGEEALRSIPATIEVEEEDNEGGERLRQDWFYYQRAYPAKTIPPDAALRMREQLETEELRMRQTRLAAGLAEEPEIGRASCRERV